MAERAHLRSTLFRVMKERGISRIVTGGATGADHFAEEWAKLARVSRSVYLADWNQHGKGAGPIRNQEMLDKGQPTLVIAFPGGKGTADMIARARAAGIEVMEPGGPS
jgi:predicted Rossmann-fold nucleotide-binding protein